MDLGVHLRMVDPVTATHPGPSSESRTLENHDQSLDEQADARPKRKLDNFNTASKAYWKNMHERKADLFSRDEIL